MVFFVQQSVLEVRKKTYNSFIINDSAFHIKKMFWKKSFHEQHIYDILLVWRAGWFSFLKPEAIKFLAFGFFLELRFFALPVLVPCLVVVLWVPCLLTTIRGKKNIVRDSRIYRQISQEFLKHCPDTIQHQMGSVFLLNAYEVTNCLKCLQCDHA